MSALGDRIRELRLREGWKKKRLAELSGVLERTIHRIETGESANPHDDTLQLLANAFNIDVRELIELRDREPPDIPQTAPTASDATETMTAPEMPNDTTHPELVAPVHSELQRQSWRARFGRRRVVYLGAVALVCLILLATGAFFATSWAKSDSVTITGKVSCVDNLRIVGVWISVNSGSGFANPYKINSSGSAVQFTFTLPHGGAYNVHVGCGGSRDDWLNTDYTEIGSGAVKDYKFHVFTCQDTPLTAGHGPCYLTQ